MNLVAKMSIPSRNTTLWEVIGARLLNPKWKIADSACYRPAAVQAADSEP
jgi:hypothetical protein